MAIDYRELSKEEYVDALCLLIKRVEDYRRHVYNPGEGIAPIVIKGSSLILDLLESCGKEE